MASCFAYWKLFIKTMSSYALYYGFENISQIHIINHLINTLKYTIDAIGSLYGWFWICPVWKVDCFSLSWDRIHCRCIIIIHYLECRGEVTIQCIQANLTKVSWFLYELVRQLSKAKKPREIKEQCTLTPPPVLSEWRWEVFEKCIAFEGCCYLGYHFLSLYCILESSLAWRWDWAMEE